MAPVTAAAPRVSVLVTAFNRARYISAAIESVLAQTFTDFELIVVDNCSTDDTVAIARRYESDPRVAVFVNDSNIGQFPNRNRAATLARGELFKYHDSDDVMYPHCLETMVAALDAEPRAAFALSRGSAWHGGPCPMLITPRMAYQREFLGTRMFMCGPSGAMFRTAAFRELGGFENAGAPSDYRFWLRACARVPVVLVPADLFWYRVHAGQELRAPGVVREYARVAAAAWEALAAEECPLLPAERARARRHHAFDVAREAFRSAVRGDLALAWYRLRHAGLNLGEWLRYLRRPRRDPAAGVAVDGNGEYAVPAPTIVARPRREAL